MVEFENTLLFVGGCETDDGKTIFQLKSPQKDETWLQLNQTMTDQRTYHVAFLVPDEITNCS
jgi:hypothetical protein